MIEPFAKLMREEGYLVTFHKKNKKKKLYTHRTANPFSKVQINIVLMNANEKKLDKILRKEARLTSYNIPRRFS